ncbi:MAG TPA: peptidoglycan-binding domain-containing protein [Rhizobiaceae bacterium]|nr:peptidoglycan-binding domain-containing protein [Rhizobiaceae bacterium]
MRRNASQPDRWEDFSFLAWAIHAAGDAIARNPLVVGGCTAFLVTLSYVSANALWYQPHFHEGAFFSTRQSMHHESLIHQHARPKAATPHAARPAPVAASRPAPVSQSLPSKGQAAGAPPQQANQQNAATLAVQAALTELKYYDGPIDGLMGPQTRSAVTDFQKASHLDVSGNIDSALLDKLNLSGPKPVATNSPGSSAPPQPQPRPVVDASLTQSVPHDGDDDVTKRNIRIQAGLKAFGNNDMKLDGVIGPRTKAAIKEFQSLFGLPVTGEPDDRLLAKMRQVGLTN